jgi:hypothetical protein
LDIQQSNNFFRECIITHELSKNNIEKHEIINIIDKCMKHITCLCCMDTKKILETSESWFGGTFEEFTCPPCTGQKIRLDSHHHVSHCKVNGRQVPYHGGNYSQQYSHIKEMYDIYKKDYEKVDLLIEENTRLKDAKNHDSSDGSKEEPRWDFMDDKVFKQEINSTDVEVNISKLVEDISKLMAISAGNLAALPSFLTGIKLTFKNYWSNESSRNSSVHRLKDDKGETVYIKFEYNKEIEESTVAVGILRAKAIVKKHFLCVSYFMAKPTKYNKPAENICEELMNTTIQSVINKLNYQIKN